MSIFTKIGDWFVHLWNSLKPELKVIVADAIKAITVVTTLMANPTVDEVLAAISNGTINAEVIAQLNTILQKLLAGLLDVQKLTGLDDNAQLVVLSAHIAQANPMQQKAFLKQAATEIAIATGKITDEAKLDSKMTAAIQGKFAELEAA